jgi:hypothetical protein
MGEDSVALYPWDSMEVITFVGEGVPARGLGLQEELRSLTVADLAVPGIPSGARQAFRRLRIVGYVGAIDGVVATAVPSRQEINIDASEFFALSSEEKLQVLKHEAAHIALAQFFGHENVPPWFNEGFAEWASPDPTCRDRVRLRLEFLRRLRTGLAWPSVRDNTGVLTGRLHRDFLASFFRYVDRRKPGVIESGELLKGVSTYGLNAGFLHAVATDLDALEAEWVHEQTLLPQTELRDVCKQL